MIGASIGTVLAVALLAIYRKDDKAVKAHKDEILRRQKEIQDRLRKRQEDQKKYMSDPKIQERKRQMETQFTNKMFSALNTEDRNLVEEYLKSNNDGTKSDSEVIKTTALKLAGFFIAVLLFIIFAIVFMLVMKQQGTDIVQLAKDTVGTVYPRLSDNITEL